MDVDGTLTDGKIYMGNEGELMKAFDVKDGCGIHDLLIPAGIEPIIITKRESLILKNRCKEIGIEKVYQGVSDKTEIVKKIIDNVNPGEVAYIGDDINDLPAINLVKSGSGIIGCPRDASLKVKEVSDFIAEREGGHGAVREFIEWILENT